MTSMEDKEDITKTSLNKDQTDDNVLFEISTKKLQNLMISITISRESIATKETIEEEEKVKEVEMNVMLIKEYQIEMQSST